jgi:crotonobetainyl-CoA:carnitine CoA-transferase CaiB-like acyl-CoA transferase
MTGHLPFEGLTVFDATQGVAGPHATMLMAQHGANVIKIEPLDGDWGRTLGKEYGDLCAHAVAFNRGKRSIAIDMKHPEGIALARKLAVKADVVVESFRPGVMKKFGLSHEDLKAENPAQVYLSVTGFGQDGPYNTLPVTDSVIQAFSGWMSINKDERGTPQRIGMIAVDVMTGLYAFSALSTAIIKQFRFGEGGYVDCSLMQSAAAFQVAKIMEYHLEGGAPQVLYVPVGTMKTSDGFINVTAMRDHHYTGLCKVIGREDMAEDPKYDTRNKRLAHEDEIMQMVRAEFIKRSTGEWAQLLTEAGVMNAPVADYGDFMANEQVKAVEAISWIKHDGLGRVPMANIPGLPTIDGEDAMALAPHIGEQSRAILAEAGLSDDDVEALIDNKAVGAYAG